MWLLLDLALVVLGLVLLVLSCMRSWRHLKKMTGAGERLSMRAGELGTKAAALSERLQLDELPSLAAPGADPTARHRR